ncbi:MAG: universal stress protein [Bacteroidales bacterium]|nr:universal stress protein [Bacteroidales bacterium]
MENENNNVVLVAYDFTKIGDIAIENAARMAKLLGYKICLLHVINSSSKKNLKKAKQPLAFINEKLKTISASLTQEHNIEVDFIAREGSIFTTIAEESNRIGANFLVFGTHGKKGIQFLLGSFAIKLVKSCPVPVFVVQKPAKESTFKDIVFPLDLQPGSKQKIKWAISLHKQFNCKFHLFIDSYPDEYIQNRIRADLNQVKKILEKHNIPYTETHSPARSKFAFNIIKFAHNMKADMIMISTDPDKITWNLFGSMDERIIYNQLKIPVMCINAQDLRVIIGGL